MKQTQVFSTVSEPVHLLVDVAALGVSLLGLATALLLLWFVG